MIYLHIGLCKTGTTFLQKNIFPYWMKKNNIQFINKLLVNEITDYHENVLISNEGFTGGTDIDKNNYINCIKTGLNLFSDVKVIITYRDSESLLSSLYKEKVKNGLSISFNEFSKTTNLEKSISEIKSFLKQNLDSKNLLELDYKDLFNNEIFYDKIANFMSIKSLTKEEIKNISKKTNKSHSKTAILILRHFNKIHWKWGTKILQIILR